MSPLKPNAGPGEEADDNKNFYHVIIQKDYRVSPEEKSVALVLRGEIELRLQSSTLPEATKMAFMVELNDVLRRMIAATPYFESSEPVKDSLDHTVILKDEWVEQLQEVADKIWREIEITGSALPADQRQKKPSRIPGPMTMSSSIPPISTRERLVTGDFTVLTIPPGGIPTLRPPDVVSGWPAPPPLPGEKKPK